MTPDEMKALIAEARGGFPTVDEVKRYPIGASGMIVRLANALEAAYDAGRRELAERFANQDTTRKAAIEELMAWEDEHDALSAHPAEDDLIEQATWVLIEHDGTWYDGDPSEEHYAERRADVERVAPILARAAHPAEETVTTVEELDALPVGSVVRTDPPQQFPSETTYVRFAGGWTQTWYAGFSGPVKLPARVLYHPVLTDGNPN